MSNNNQDEFEFFEFENDELEVKDDELSDDPNDSDNNEDDVQDSDEESFKDQDTDQEDEQDNEEDEEQEESSTDEESEESEEFDVLTDSFNYLKEKGIIILPEDYNFENTEEGFEKAIQDSFENLKSLAYNSILENIPDETKELANYLLSGGTDIENYKKYTSEVSLDDVDLEDPEQRKQILTLLYKEKGFSEAKIQKNVSRIIDLGEDEEEAKEALPELKSIYEKRKENFEKEVKAQRELEKQKEKENYEKLMNTINSTTKIGNVEFTKEEKAKFKNFLQEKVKVGNNQVMLSFDYKLQQYLSDPEKFVVLGTFLMKDFDTQKIEKEIEKKSNSKFFDKIRRNNKTKNTPSGRTERSSRSDIDITKGEFLLK